MARLLSLNIYIPFGFEKECITQNSKLHIVEGIIRQPSESILDVIIQDAKPLLASSEEDLIANSDPSTSIGYLHQSSTTTPKLYHSKFNFTLENSRIILTDHSDDYSINNIYYIYYDRNTKYKYSLDRDEEKTLSSLEHLNNGNSKARREAIEYSLFNTPINSSILKKHLENISRIGMSFNMILDLILGFLIIYHVWKLDESTLIDLKKRFISLYKYILINMFQHFEWLIKDSNPGGIKLNKQLNIILGQMALGGLRWWQTLLSFGFYYLSDFFTVDLFRVLIWSISSSCLMGASTMLALVCDLLLVVSINILLFYRIISRLYNQLIHLIFSLWRLFRGKKANPLKKRLDNCEDYSNDQLILGIILFTICIFLYPTVAVYYLSFSFLFFSIVSIRKIITSIMVLIHNFPINQLLNLNGCRNEGIKFTTLKNGYNYLHIHSSKIPLSQVISNSLQPVIRQIFLSNTQPLNNTDTGLVEETSSNIILRLIYGYSLFYNK
ncbi:predicted protein [Naegleria gruberi]|uniref:Predicted protein n=1 Tax=Naegleria gruberi TaxID=5762 RepID=D2VZN9_NAEGR|nr:uncharacterized protein NAEGRDRAFT_74555 [Naegleria gruberi]EFC37729.1 predicted protein [Naegleria gruberi]|eukprot:XP_002670473.1 predicted protein [Naegleria gruberi strain NEG-M]